MRLIFAGSPDFSVPSLQALVTAGHDVCAVFTQPDRPAGRGRKLAANPVKQAALALGIPVYQPMSLKTAEALAELAALDCEAMIVAAYGLLLPQAVLDLPTYGCLNVHASLLPRWRGAAPTHRAIQAGDSETGVTIMQMALGLDTGDMLAKATVAITPDTTGACLHDELAHVGAELLTTVLADLPKFKQQAETQDENQSNYAKKLAKAESWLNWQQPAATLDRQIRAFNPWPGSQTTLREGANEHDQSLTIKIWAARPLNANDLADSQQAIEPGKILSFSDAGLTVQCGQATLLVTELQPAGKRRMPAADFARSRQLENAAFLSSPTE